MITEFFFSENLRLKFCTSFVFKKKNCLALDQPKTSCDLQRYYSQALIAITIIIIFVIQPLV